MPTHVHSNNHCAANSQLFQTTKAGLEVNFQFYKIKKGGQDSTGEASSNSSRQTRLCPLQNIIIHYYNYTIITIITHYIIMLHLSLSSTFLVLLNPSCWKRKYK